MYIHKAVRLTKLYITSSLFKWITYHNIAVVMAIRRRIRRTNQKSIFPNIYSGLLKPTNRTSDVTYPI